MANDKGIALRHLDTLTNWAPVRIPSEINPELRARFDVSATSVLPFVKRSA